MIQNMKSTLFAVYFLYYPWLLRIDWAIRMTKVQKVISINNMPKINKWIEKFHQLKLKNKYFFPTLL